MRQKWFLLLAGVLAAIALIALLTYQPEPSYQDRSLSSWLVLYDPMNLEADLANRMVADAIRRFGTNALPFFLEWVRYEPQNLRSKRTLKSLLHKLPEAATPEILGTWIYTDAKRDRADAAAAAFGLFSDDAQLVIPQLSKLMNDPALPTASQRAIFALAFIGKVAIPALSAQLTDTNTPHRAVVAEVFGMSVFSALATNADFIVPLLVRCLEDHDQDVRERAALSLGRIGQRYHVQPEMVVPALTNCLRADSPLALRNQAIRALGEYGDQAREAVPVLLRMTTDPERLLRIRATNALLKIAPSKWPILDIDHP